MFSSFLYALAAAPLLTQVAAHTWIEQLSVIKDGKFVGNYGYPRSYVSRSDPGYSGETSQYLLPPLEGGRLRVNSDDLLCRKDQRTQTQSDKWPRLSVAPGSYIAMKYNENGHVSLPDTNIGKPEAGGTVFVYGTLEPKDDEKLMNVLEWTADGSGGDKRGKLIATNNYDDGRCYQINGGEISVKRQEEFPNPTPNADGSKNEQLCETDVQIPEDAEAGKLYTLYWVWQWPTAAKADPTYPNGKDEWYTSCSDVELTSASSLQQSLATGGEPKYVLEQQDPQTAADKSWKERTALTTDPAQGMASASSSGGSGSSAATTPGSTPSSSPASVVTPTPAPTPATTPAGNENAEPLETVYVTVTASPSKSNVVTKMITVTGSAPQVTQYQTTTVGVGARAPARRSPKLPLGHHRRGVANADSEPTSEFGFQADEHVQKATDQSPTSAASSTMAVPSLMTLMLFTIAFAFA